jgi:ubiquinone/menaquinone biosynthesis C-methylase UbiE
MNFKFLFPTFLNRYDFVERSLNLYRTGAPERILNIGTGEGDYDPMIARYCVRLVGCDQNEDDLNFARVRNWDNPIIEYRTENALNLSFDDDTFDKVIAVEVLEHVSDPSGMLGNIFRVLKPSGIAILTFPSLHFPITYDPVNRILSWFSERHFSMGAYAFGHTYLVAPADFRTWAYECGFEVLQEEPLSGYLVGLIEVYWTGLVQRIFKVNAFNKQANRSANLIATRPGNKIPALTILSRAVAKLDSRYFTSSKNSVGKGFVLKKKGDSQ